MSFTLRELAEKTGMSTFAIRSWVSRGRIPRTEAHGPLTRYEDEHLLRILAIQALRASGTRLRDACARVAAITSHDELRVVAGLAVEPVPVEARAAATPAVRPHRADNARAHEMWEHVPLCPGVELRVRVDADSEAKRVAIEIEQAYAR